MLPGLLSPWDEEGLGRAHLAEPNCLRPLWFLNRSFPGRAQRELLCTGQTGIIPQVSWKLHSKGRQSVGPCPEVLLEAAGSLFGFNLL